MWNEENWLFLKKIFFETAIIALLCLALIPLKYLMADTKSNLNAKSDNKWTTSAKTDSTKNDKKDEKLIKPPIDKLDINFAATSDLVQLNGVGEVIAQRIVAYRKQNGPFLDVKMLIEVKGIGQGKLNGIIDNILVNPKHLELYYVEQEMD